MSTLPSNPFRWGIIGPGRIAHKFALGLGAMPGATISAVASRDIERADSFTSQFGGKAFGSYTQMLESKLVDAVYIATPHNFHLEHTLLALERKVPVLCEKPLAVNANQALNMTQSSHQNHTFLMEGLWTRFLPHIRFIEEIQANGDFGALKFIQADFGFKAIFNPDSRLFNPNLAGGALLDIGIYPLFLSTFFLGKPTSIAVSADLASTGVDEAVFLQLEFENKSKAQLMASVRHKSRTSARFVFDRGEIEIEEQWLRPANLIVRNEGNELSEVFNFPPLVNGFEYEALEVQRCVEDGKIESELMPHVFSTSLLELMDQIRAEIGVKYPFE
jgi:predicted dehydrogenase